MKSPTRVRFAPSPTGQVHIGNIRVAIMNYLFARHEQGAFLLRVEDTDRERSTPEAIAGLLEVLNWLDLPPDEEPLFQSARIEAHLAVAEQLIADGFAYRHARNADETPAVFFRLPYEDAVYGPHLRTVGEARIALHPGEPLRIDHTGIHFFTSSKKGTPVENLCCLAGMKDLQVVNQHGGVSFDLREAWGPIAAGREAFQSPLAAELRFLRRELVFQDLVKGELAKALDAMKDLVIVRGDGNPVFHLANVCDDVEQAVTHVIRGDDHVENTYRHIPLFLAMGKTPPAYAHLPMIVNAQGKPYSKRDGDAYVGDFRSQGYLPEALTNYLVLLGWAPGDDREKMNRDELIAAFTLERVQRSPAQMDLRKLQALNGQYIQALPRDQYLADVRDVLGQVSWAAGADPDFVAAVADLLRLRVSTYIDLLGWAYFFTDAFPYLDAAVDRALGKAWQKDGLATLASVLEQGGQGIDAVRAAERAAGLEEGKLNLTTRVAVTGTHAGADLAETLALIGPGAVRARVLSCLNRLA